MTDILSDIEVLSLEKEVHSILLKNNLSPDIHPILVYDLMLFILEKERRIFRNMDHLLKG